MAGVERDGNGWSRNRYVTERSSKAEQAMRAANQASLAQIAFDTDFGSQANFNRVFRRATGLTPGNYREMRQR